MALGVEHTVKFFDELSVVVVGCLELAKAGLGWGAYGKALALLARLKAIVTDAKASLPELKDLTAEESVEVCAACYTCFAKIVAAV